MKNVIRVLCLLLCTIFVFCSCGKKPEENESQSEPVSVSSEESNIEESSAPQSSSEENNGQVSEEDNTPFGFEAVTVSGGTIVGTTSKGYTIKVKDGVTYIGGVLVVNKTYSLPKSYNPGLNSVCKTAFEKMKAGAKKDGINVWISSGYRNYYRQDELYSYYCKRDGVAAADRYSARPGHSEHQAGLAIDVNSASTVAYNNTYKNVGEWIAAHCWEYGFILRYPEGKEDITGYKYEAWHIRYVGIELSTKIKESGLTLEEYFGITSSYTSVEENEEKESSVTEESEEASSDSENNSGSSSKDIQEGDSSDLNNDSSQDEEQNEESTDSNNSDESDSSGNETGSDT